MVQMHQESIDRIRRDLSDLNVPSYAIPKSFEPVAFDLDLFGNQSLFQLLAITRTPFGSKTLGDWICAGASESEIEARQIAVAELSNQQTWRQGFRLRCEQLAASQAGPSRFVEWAESGNWIDQRQWLLWLCRVTAVTSIASIAALLFGILPLTVAGPTLLVTIGLNFFISVFFAGSIHDIFNQISSRQDEVRHYETIFKEVIKFKTESPFLKTIQSELAGDSEDVLSDMRSLAFKNWLANIRRDGMLFIPYLICEFLFMWDIHILRLLENWKGRHGAKARQWFNALGRFEAIMALSKLAHDNPDWQFPEITGAASGSVVDCEGLGHPLMDNSRVTNDVRVGPQGTVLLVSGSNMSGKSTLLRSLGVNSVLAQMGSKVCAEKMSLPLVRIESSMRIVDSLATGTSFFMAELKRLKEIVDQAAKFKDDSDLQLMFLLDEILQGTNSRERQIAVA
ncbi:MAG: hypothetical protein AAGA30_21245, partial [Planctomycetota bacterium]